MSNWFIALPITPGDWLQCVQPAPPCVRVFEPVDLHLTVAFLGSVGEERARRAWQALAWPLHPTEISLGEVVPLGPATKPSALSALLRKGRRDVEAAIASVRDTLHDRAEVSREARAPLAHVTIARPQRAATDHQRRQAVDWAARLNLGEPVITLNRIALYTWSHDRSRSLFRIVNERSTVTQL
jgi:2'-5' RNA ligase